jgi:hypothetical protein
VKQNGLTSNSEAVIKKQNIMKKQYQQPMTAAIAVQSSSVLCASGSGFIPTGGPVGGVNGD